MRGTPDAVAPRGPAILTLLCAGFSLSDDGFECVHVVNCEFAEHLTIHLDALLRQKVNQLTVLHVGFRASSGNTRDPKLSELSLACPSVTEGILPRLHHLFVGSAVDVFLTSPIPRGPLDDFLMSLVAH